MMERKIEVEEFLLLLDNEIDHDNFDVSEAGVRVAGLGIEDYRYLSKGEAKVLQQLASEAKLDFPCTLADVHAWVGRIDMGYSVNVDSLLKHIDAKSTQELTANIDVLSATEDAEFNQAWHEINNNRTKDLIVQVKDGKLPSTLYIRDIWPLLYKDNPHRYWLALWETSVSGKYLDVINELVETVKDTSETPNTVVEHGIDAYHALRVLRSIGLESYLEEQDGIDLRRLIQGSYLSGWFESEKNLSSGIDWQALESNVFLGSDIANTRAVKLAWMALLKKDSSTQPRKDELVNIFKFGLGVSSLNEEAKLAGTERGISYEESAEIIRDRIVAWKPNKGLKGFEWKKSEGDFKHMSVERIGKKVGELNRDFFEKNSWACK